jgi:phosphohistidine phosphatase
VIELALARHAHAGSGAPSVPDHDRPLCTRGRTEAAERAVQLQSRGFRPRRILSSTAVRARETADALAAALGAEVELDPLLYLAEPDALWEAATTSGADAVLIVAHEPGLSALVHELTGSVAGMAPSTVVRLRWETATWVDALDVAPTDWSVHAPR